MPIDNIITGQTIDPDKLERARELRRHMTPAESRLWQALRGKQLDGFKFRRQQIIDGFIVDFYCHAAGLVIEVDGSIHDEAEQAEYDAERTRALTARGLYVMRIRNEDILTDIDTVLTRIHHTCHDRTATLNQSTPPRVGEGPGEGST